MEEEKELFALKCFWSGSWKWLYPHGGASDFGKAGRMVGTRGEILKVAASGCHDTWDRVRFVRIKRKLRAVEKLYRVRFSIDWGSGPGEYFASTSLNGHGNDVSWGDRGAKLPLDQAQNLAAKVIEAQGQYFRSVSIEPVP